MEFIKISNRTLKRESLIRKWKSTIISIMYTGGNNLIRKWKPESENSKQLWITKTAFFLQTKDKALQLDSKFQSTKTLIVKSFLQDRLTTNKHYWTFMLPHITSRIIIYINRDILPRFFQIFAEEGLKYGSERTLTSGPKVWVSFFLKS